MEIVCFEPALMYDIHLIKGAPSVDHRAGSGRIDRGTLNHGEVDCSLIDWVSTLIVEMASES